MNDYNDPSFNDAQEPPPGMFEEDARADSGLCPQGTHKGKGVPGSARWGKDRNGTTMCAVTVQLANEHQVTCSMSFAGKAEPISRQRLVALGWDLSDSMDLHGLGSKEVQVEVTHEPWTTSRGEKKVSVKGQVLVSGFEFQNKMNEGEVGNFLRQQAAAAKAIGSSPAGAAPQQGQGRRLDLGGRR